jgi:hypothetical protein
MGNSHAGSAVVSNDMMRIIINWEECGRKQSWPMLRYCPRMCSGTQKNLASPQGKIQAQNFTNKNKEC